MASDYYTVQRDGETRTIHAIDLAVCQDGGWQLVPEGEDAIAFTTSNKQVADNDPLAIVVNEETPPGLVKVEDATPADQTPNLKPSPAKTPHLPEDLDASSVTQEEKSATKKSAK